MSEHSSTSSRPVLILCRDLMFTSKITSTAQSVGVPIKILREPAKLADAVGDSLIADLNEESFLEPAAEWKRRTGGQLCGFVSHVNTDTIARARSQGFDNVIPRGAFNARLGDILLNCAAPTSSAPDHPSDPDKA